MFHLLGFSAPVSFHPYGARCSPSHFTDQPSSGKPGAGQSGPAAWWPSGPGTSGFDVPAGWVPVAARAVDTRSPAYRVITGGMVDFWHQPALSNGWAQLGSGFANAAYRKDTGGVVRLRGVVRSGTFDASGGAAGTIFTLPLGFRPEARAMFAAPSVGGGTDAYGRVDVKPTGEVVAIFGTSTFIGLDGVAFAGYQ